MGSELIGVCYGLNGDNLPDPKDAIKLCRSNGITKIRLYEPKKTVLEALENSGITVILGVPNEYIPLFAKSKDAASEWVNNHVKPYINDVQIWCIAVGNFVDVPTDAILRDLLAAIQNVSKAISSAHIGNIKVSVEINLEFLAPFDKPEDAFFNIRVRQYIEQIIGYIFGSKDPVILFNIHPYFAHINNPNKFRLPFSLFTGEDKRYLPYQNLFDYLVAALYYAVKEVSGNSEKKFAVVVSETGWPSDGCNCANYLNAKTYYSNLITHFSGNTPNPNTTIQPKQIYLFSLFDENLRGPYVSDKHFGIFYPSTQKYPKVPE